MLKLNRASVPVIQVPDGRARPTLVTAAQTQQSAPRAVGVPAAITPLRDGVMRSPKPKKQSKADRWMAAIANAREAVADLEAIRDELQDWYDNMPEGLQGSAKGEAVSEVATACEETVDALNEALETGEAVEFSY